MAVDVDINGIGVHRGRIDQVAHGERDRAGHRYAGRAVRRTRRNAGVNDPLPYPVRARRERTGEGRDRVAFRVLEAADRHVIELGSCQRRALGTKVRVTPSLASVTVPAMALPPDGVTVIELLVTVVGSMSSLITAMICAFSGTPVCAVRWTDGADRGGARVRTPNRSRSCCCSRSR